MRIRSADDEIAGAFVAGAPDALRQVYDRHQRPVYTYCRRFVSSDHAADVTQEVFLSAWRSRERFDPSTGSLGGWLMGIARFKVLDHLRGAYRNQSVASGDMVDLSTGAAAGATDAELDRVATRLLVADALERLDEPACTWIHLAFIDGLSHTEIAERSGAPLGTVKSSIRRGLERIRRDLEAFDGQA